MGEYKLTKTISGKYKVLKFIEGELYICEKNGDYPVDILAELEQVYGDKEFSLSTTCKEESDATPDDEIILE